MKLNLFNTVNNEECRLSQWSVVSGLAQAWTALLASPLCAQYNVFLAATLFVLPQDNSFTPSPPPPPQGFANFIDEWSLCDFCFTNFGVNFGVKYGKFGVFANPAPPFIFPLINQCDRCLVPLAWGFMAGGHGFASHGDTTLSRGWLCQKWKPLDILGTHLH